MCFLKWKINKQSYMKKLLGEQQKLYWWQDHANEAKFPKQFHKHSQQGLTCGSKSNVIYETSLVVSTKDNFFLDFADAEIVYTHRNNETNNDNDDNEALNSMAIKIKSCLSRSFNLL